MLPLRPKRELMQAKLEQVDDEYFVILPVELMEKMDIKEGDSLTWVIEGDNITLRKNIS
jgi:bifunctional DNA-binding transcriptional regulator/antitoxin component of YhaV-PrlF toxin-antitoxin module